MARPMDLELNGRCALVTGGAGESGLAVARALAAEGADIARLARTGGRWSGRHEI